MYVFRVYFRRLSSHNLDQEKFLFGYGRGQYRYPNDTDITIDGIKLHVPHPPLNIFRGVLSHLYVYDGKQYHEDFLYPRGTCRAMQKYVWGFSLLLLFIVSIFTMLFTFIMIALWVSADRGSYLARERRKLGPFRAVMDLAKVVNEELGPEADSLSDEELIKRLERSSNGMMYSKETLRVFRSEYACPKRSAGKKMDTSDVELTSIDDRRR